MNGENITLPSGMVRGSTVGKVNFLLVRDGPMLERWARLLTNQVPNKGKRNWLKAHTEEDLERFLESLDRHVAQYLNGETNEDHAAAILFNCNGAEHVKDQLGRSSDLTLDIAVAHRCEATLLGKRCVNSVGHPDKHFSPDGDKSIWWTA